MCDYELEECQKEGAGYRCVPVRQRCAAAGGRSYTCPLDRYVCGTDRCLLKDGTESPPQQCLECLKDKSLLDVAGLVGGVAAGFSPAFDLGAGLIGGAGYLGAFATLVQPITLAVYTDLFMAANGRGRPLDDCAVPVYYGRDITSLKTGFGWFSSMLTSQACVM
ncbi:hypothetical protein HXX76_016313 [Chlamydomonas incerta]|uniref:Uncharacterized protein n=1 Tax=Chlamydomonas incerta TaxID=51695 RepID=A0A835VQS3_CHLIN|nr:hypothetical protein HXX76_016313 [Chlamydomonas incerta]|eukprot:KAG2422051.1 hypothetical protein HXX76_016313 [Chlamydomonas incerta]